MRAAAVAILLCLSVISAQPAKVRRSSVAAMEKSFDQSLLRLGDNPFTLVGNTRGLHLAGYGAVFTAEVNLIMGPTLSPFRQTISPEDIVRLHERKIERLPHLRRTMREMLLSAAASLDDVPATERIVLGVRLLYLPYENTEGLPAHILMQGERARLLDAKLGRVPAEAALAVVEDF
ncbi:MAG: hypothetical protein IPM24_13770 [Bryobacterales bacterium]|nr:hypothetical protein [Bryobacterales bacterium]